MSAAEENHGRPLIEMRDVAVAAFGQPARVVVEHITWTIVAGDYWVVAGLHGSGKSDLLMMTAGLTAPAYGQYRFCNEQMPILEEAKLGTRLRLGLLFDGGRLFSQLTVAENIALPLRYHRNVSTQETAEQVQQLLRLTELEQWADLTPAALGRNWQRRVGLARALVLQPDVLLLDNPLSGLDTRHVQWWLRFLDELSAGHEFMRAKPVTLIVASDTLLPWRGHARQIALLDGKQCVAVGSWAQAPQLADTKLKELLTELGG